MFPTRRVPVCVLTQHRRRLWPPPTVCFHPGVSPPLPVFPEEKAFVLPQKCPPPLPPFLPPPPPGLLYRRSWTKWYPVAQGKFFPLPPYKVPQEWTFELKTCGKRPHPFGNRPGGKDSLSLEYNRPHCRGQCSPKSANPKV